MPHRFLVTGASGQDGGYLVDLALNGGHEVHGMCHTAAAAAELTRDHPGSVAHVADLADDVGLRSLIDEVQPDRIVNLAGRTSVAWSWESPVEAADLVGVAPVRIYDAALQLMPRIPAIRVLQASSAEIFGDAREVPQSERTTIAPVNPYGAAKAFAHHMAGVFRSRGLHVSTAILYNHESPRRPESFVMRKVVTAAVRIAAGLQQELVIGNLDAERDWGWAPDYAAAMLHIVELQEPADFVVATGESHSVREVVSEAFQAAGVSDWASHVRVDPDLFRPVDPARLVGDASLLRASGWAPSVDFASMIRNMVTAEQQTAGRVG